MDWLTLALGLGTQLFSNYQSQQNTEEAIQANKELQQNQLAWNYQMWQLNNDYNLPVNQVKRLKAAGLNPALMYGNVGSSGTSSSPAQSVNPVQVQPKIASFSGISDTLGQVFDRLLQQKIAESNIAKNSADSTKALADAAEASANAKRAGADTDRINYEINKLLPTLVGLNESNISLNSLKGNLLTKQVEESKARVSEISSKIELNSQQRLLLEKQLSWYDKVQSTNIYVDTLNAISNKRNADSTNLSVKSNVALQSLISEGERINNELRKLYGKHQARYAIDEQILRNRQLIKELREVQLGPLKISEPTYRLNLPYGLGYNY